MVKETVRIYGEQIKGMAQARLNALLEGYERHNVEIDDALAESTIKEIMDLRASMAAKVRDAPNQLERGPVSLEIYRQLVDQAAMMSYNEIKIQIDRKRLMPKKDEGKAQVTNVYHVYGHNPRWNVNSSDNSANTVTVSSDQVFANLRQELESRVSDGEERADILEKLTALEQSQNSPSFGKRYTEFVAAAANHMILLSPFIPALTELLHKTLG
jgi:hypothetical protein